MRVVDLRSDTVTHPSEEMRRAMYEAELGDDVFGDDPTLNRLEAMAAERFGKEAAVFVASGTMGNLVSVLAHTTRGDEIILGNQSHIFRSEAGGSSVLGGISFHTVPNDERGMLDADDVRAAIRPNDPAYAAHRACVSRKHPERLRRRGADSGRHKLDCGRRPRERAGAAHRRRAHIQRGRRAGSARGRAYTRGGLDHVLPVQGA